MAPTTAAESTLVTSSIISNFDWILIRDSSRRLPVFPDGLGIAVSDCGAESVGVVIDCKD